MYSMTGYGKSTVEIDGREMTIELKSINNRFLDVNTKLPKMLLCVEDVLKKTIASKLSRGRVDVFVSYVDKRSIEKNVTVDMGLAKGYFSAKNKLLSELNITDDITASVLMRMPDVIKVESVDDDLEILKSLMEQATLGAITELNKMRSTEGEKLKQDMLARVDSIESLLGTIRQHAPEVAENYRLKLTARVEEVLAGIEIDQNKLINEVAFFTDKSNIDEEITRLLSHISQARTMLSTEQLVGRKLDFLIQEFNRETNTICSKSNNVTLTNTALSMKSEVEKIREQIQNIE